MAGWPGSPTSRRAALDELLARSVLSCDDILDADGVLQVGVEGVAGAFCLMPAANDPHADLFLPPPSPSDFFIS
jgi:hypothetical protein